MIQPFDQKVGLVITFMVDWLVFILLLMALYQSCQCFSGLTNYKYSFFDAIDEFRELVFRNSHAYQNIQVAVLNFAGKLITFGSLNSEYKYSSNSYTAARLSLNSGDDHRAYVKSTRKELSFLQRAGTQSFLIIMSFFLSSHNKVMIKENPRQFFKTAKHPVSIWIGCKLNLR